jgi:hypothetical protein
MKPAYFTIHPGKNPPPQNGCRLKSVVFLKHRFHILHFPTSTRRTLKYPLRTCRGQLLQKIPCPPVDARHSTSHSRCSPSSTCHSAKNGSQIWSLVIPQNTDLRSSHSNGHPNLTRVQNVVLHDEVLQTLSSFTMESFRHCRPSYIVIPQTAARPARKRKKHCSCILEGRLTTNPILIALHLQGSQIQYICALPPSN